MDNENYVEELNTIIHIAIENGYTEDLIHRLNLKIKSNIQKHNLSTLHTVEENPKKYITVTYNSNTSNIMKKILNIYGYTIAHQTNNKLQQKLNSVHNNIKIDCGVYKLLCNNCAKFYIGKTGRTFEQRFREHTQEANNVHKVGTFKSNYAEHLVNEKHTYTDMHNNLQVMHKIINNNTLDRMEEYEIYKERKNPMLMNEKLNTRKNKIYELIIQNERRQHQQNL